MPYSFRFSGNEAYRFTPGSLFLGLDPERFYPVGIETERHAITVAGAGAGKGAAIIIPNLLRWPHNAIVIDPKGEAAEATAAAREKMGQAVHVLDPFRVADVPDRFRAKLNPLGNFDRNAIDARESINAIADGMVMRSDAKAAHWDNGGLSVIAGLCAWLIDQAPPEHCTLAELRRTLILPPDDFQDVLDEMGRNNAFGNLPATGAAKLTSTGSEAGHFRSTADENTKWLDSPAMAELLSGSTFDIADLKTKPCTVYLVLPPQMTVEHSRFLRLFVRMALNAMARGGVKGGRRCLFLLDEFFSLGRIDEIAKAAGLMRGYGVSLWPILQDLGQLETMYGREGMHTFFGSADAHIFFGNSDAMTLDYVSARIGKVTLEQVQAPPQKYIFKSTGYLDTERERPQAINWDSHYINDMNVYQHEKAAIGSARMPPEAVRDKVKKGRGDYVAGSMIVFANGRDVLDVRPSPYFVKPPQETAGPRVPVKPAKPPFDPHVYIRPVTRWLLWRYYDFRGTLCACVAAYLLYAWNGHSFVYNGANYKDLLMICIAGVALIEWFRS